ncbi:MAG: cell division protein FtsL [Granulosicoccus sp.]
MNKTSLFAFFLAALCGCSAVAVVYSKHLSRAAYADISRYQRLIDGLDVHWSQLQIEESTFSEHGRIERAAQQSLDMLLPGLEGSIMIVRKGPGS